MHGSLFEVVFKQSLTDCCEYERIDEKSTVLILFWVDDTIIVASDNKALCPIKMDLNEKFKMKDRGRLSWFLGNEFVLKDHCIIMNQEKYCKKILERFRMSDYKPKYIPCDPSINEITDCEPIIY